MHNISDQELIKEMERRLEENRLLHAEQVQFIKELVEVNNRLREAETLKSNFLSNIKNELNDPISVLLGFTESLLKNDIEDTTTIKAAALHLHLASQNLNYQLKNIFAAAEIEAGESVVKVEEVNCRKIIESTVMMCQCKAKEKELKVLFSCDQTVPGTFSTDAEKVQLIIHNLIMNAIQFSKKCEDIRISLCGDKKQLQIFVEDNGLGLDIRDFDRIFQRFVQLDSGTTKTYKGHGLGLSIVKAYLELISGDIKVNSTSDQRTTFTIVLNPLEREAGFAEESNSFLF
jgi:signal transduction histidine kinase